MLDSRDRLLSLADIIAATPVQINPHFARTNAEIEAYCQDYAIWLPNFGDYHSMAAYMFPRAECERYLTISILMDLLWFIDDYYTRSRIDSSAQQDARLAQTFMTGMQILLYDEVQSAYEGWHYVCADLRQRVIAHNGEAWLRRLIAGLDAHLQATTLSINARLC